MCDKVKNYMDELFEKISDLQNQPINFTKPQCGGTAFKKDHVNNISTFSRLEQKIDDENISYMDDDETSTRPPQPR
jgi:hypothetical protein